MQNTESTILTNKTKQKLGELLFRISELETIVELRDQKINELNEQIKQLKSNLVTGVNND